MRISTPPASPLARTVTIPELARRTGVPRSTMFRRLRDLHTRDLQRGEDRALWLFRPRRGVWAVNLERLRLEHPELFGVPSPAELHEQIVEVRAYACAGLKAVNVRVGALAAAFREHGRQHRSASPPAPAPPPPRS